MLRANLVSLELMINLSLQVESIITARTIVFNRQKKRAVNRNLFSTGMILTNLDESEHDDKSHRIANEDEICLDFDADDICFELSKESLKIHFFMYM